MVRIPRLTPLLSACRYDSMTENAAKLEKAIIQLAEKVQLPESLDKRPQP